MDTTADHLHRVVPLERFRALLGALEAERGSLSEDYWLRFAAQTAVLVPEEPAILARKIREQARTLDEGSPWYGTLGSNVRFVVAAALVDAHEDPRFFLGEHRRLGKLFREYHFRRGALHETLAALILHIDAGHRQVDLLALGRMKALYDAMKERHWWLTGPDDLPACAALTRLTGGAEELAGEIDRLYEGLHARGLARGDRLQTAANIMPLAGVDTDELLHRFDGLQRWLERQGENLEREHYTAVALLCFLDHEPERVLATFEATLEELELSELIAPDPSNFVLAADLAVLDLLRFDRSLQPIRSSDEARRMLALLHAYRSASLVLVGQANAAWVAPADAEYMPGWPV